MNAISDALSIVKKWRKRAVSVPLFLTLKYIEDSLDSFPVEFFNIKRGYKVIFGRDFISGLEFNKDELRLQIEREIKGKLIHLRESFFESINDNNRMKSLFSASLGSFLSLFPVILYLKGIDIEFKREMIINKIADEFELNKDIFIKLLKIKEGRYKFSKDEGKKIWREYIDEINKVVIQLDKLS